ncbi:MAG: hypothetical protein ABGY11_04210 [Candidatus Thioglobus sp.]
MPLVTFHRQLHHKYYEYNYGGLEILMDQWIGLFRNGIDESYQQFITKRPHSVTSKG